MTQNTPAEAEPRKITVTFDECDLDEAALREARQLAVGALIKRGINDLNTIDPATWDLLFAVFKLAYENHKAARDHRFGVFDWSLAINGVNHTVTQGQGEA